MCTGDRKNCRWSCRIIVCKQNGYPEGIRKGKDMDKILTVTLNPAVDKTYTTKCLVAGQVNRMRTVLNIAGGKGVNVTKILRQYGYRVMATGLLGGHTGRFIEEELLRRGAECGFVQVSGETRCNMNILADDGGVTEILESGPQISEQEQTLFLERYEALLTGCKLAAISGSIARGMADDIYERLIVMARDKKVPVYLDSSGESMRKGLSAKPCFIKPNWKELEYLAGHPIADREGIIAAARHLREEGIAKVVVSMGSEGLLSVTDSGVLFARARGIEAVNTVGSGDSVVASYAMSAVLGESDEEAILRACAISAANVTTLESASIPVETAQQLMNKMVVEKISG